MRQQLLSSMCAVGVIASFGAGARADVSISDLTQSMKIAAATDLSSFWNRFGADPSSSLQLTTSVDPVLNSFSISTQPGSRWLGQPASIRTTGAWDEATRSYQYSSRQVLGSAQFSTEGTIGFDPGYGPRGAVPDTRHAELFSAGLIRYRTDAVLIIFRQGPNGTILSDGQWSTFGPQGQVYEPTFDHDTYNCTTGSISWSRWYQSTGTAYNYDGRTDPITGAGTLTGTVTPTPGTMALMAAGGLALCRRRR